jgi:hypothetical protein
MSECNINRHCDPPVGGVAIPLGKQVLLKIMFLIEGLLRHSSVHFLAIPRNDVNYLKLITHN